MPFDGSGTFTRVTNWVADATAGIKIRADKHDLQDDDIINGLSLTITRDGQTQPTNHIPLNNHRLINVAEPINDNDAVTKGWMQRSAFTLTGSDVLGRIKFLGTEADAPAGRPMGIEWAQSDMFFGVRKKPAVQPALPAPPIEARWVFNDKADASGTDWVTIEKTGQMVVAKLGVTGSLEMPGNAQGFSMNAYVGSDGSWHYRQAGHAMLLQPQTGNQGDGGQLILYGDPLGAGNATKDAVIGFTPRIYFYRRGGVYIVGSEYTYGLLVGRGIPYSIFNIYGTANYIGGGCIMYEYTSTYVAIVEYYISGSGHYSFYGNHAAILGAGGWYVSDERLKDRVNEEDLPDVLDIVKKIPVISYERKVDRLAASRVAPFPMRRTFGWRAKQIQKLLPLAVQEIQIPAQDILTRAAMKGIPLPPEDDEKGRKALGKEDLKMLVMDDHVMLAALWLAAQKIVRRIEKLEAA